MVKRKIPDSSYSFESYMKKAKEYKEKNDYNNALVELDKAIKQGVKHTRVYLSRAEIYEKLNDDAKMLKAGEALIRVAPKLPDGFYYAGKYYLNVQNYSKAASYFRRGYKRFAYYNENYTKLKKLYEIYNEDEKLDPLKNLPIEILYIIFKQLSLQELMKCCLVNRSWRHFLTNQPLLWQHLEIKNNLCQEEYVYLLLERADYQLMSLSIHCYEFDLWDFITEECSKLNELNLFFCDWYPDIVYTNWHLTVLRLQGCYDIDEEDLCDCLLNLENLQVLELVDLNLDVAKVFKMLGKEFEKNDVEKCRLKSFLLNAEYPNDSFFDFFKKYCPDMESFDLAKIKHFRNYDFQSFTKLKFISIDFFRFYGSVYTDDHWYYSLDETHPDRVLRLIQSFPKTLTHLQLKSSPLTSDMIQFLPPSLLELELYNNLGIDEAGLEAITMQCPLLTTLNLKRCYNIGDFSSLQHLKYLKVLNMFECDQLKYWDDEKFSFLLYLNQLEDLNLAATNIRCIENFLKKMPNLKKLDLYKCDLRDGEIFKAKKAKPNCLFITRPLPEPEIQRNKYMYSD